VRPRRVLVVDGDKLIADSIVGILRPHDYDASAFYSAEDALDWCLKGCPFAVITEVILGPISGVQLAIRLAKRFPDCKVLMISGHSQVCARLPDSKVFSDHFTLFAKPVEPQKILDFLACPLPKASAALTLRADVSHDPQSSVGIVLSAKAARPPIRLAPPSEAS
jgi:FixJ family two-component response regulator